MLTHNTRLAENKDFYLPKIKKYIYAWSISVIIILVIAFDKGERTLIEKNSCFYGLYDVVNLAPPENFSGANDVISMPCASVLLFGVISLDKIVLCYEEIIIEYYECIDYERKVDVLCLDLFSN